MSTPSGARSKAVWLDALGNPCGPATAVSGEIVEYDGDGVVMQRTYLDRTEDPEAAVPPASDPDDEANLPENADWIKTGEWDLWEADWSSHVTTLERFLQNQGLAGLPIPEQRRAVGRFITLPVWQSAPEGLRAETNTWLEATRQE